MMGNLFWIVLFSMVGGTLSVIIASVLLLLKIEVRDRIVPHLISFATGTLLGGAFLGLLPHALEQSSVKGAHGISMVVLLGLLVFFLLEKMLIWRHCHTSHCEAHGLDSSVKSSDHAGTLVLFGDGLHNFVDGIMIAGAFLTDFRLGVVTTLAITAHEIPQEASDFILLLQSGYSRRKALFFNVLSSLGTVLGGVLAYFALNQLESLLPYVLAFGAASFIYISVADLIPNLHRKTQLSETVEQIVLISSGICVVYVSHLSVH